MSVNAKRIGVSIFLLIRIKVANRVAMIKLIDTICALTMYTVYEYVCNHTHWPYEYCV